MRVGRHIVTQLACTRAMLRHALLIGFQFHATKSSGLVSAHAAFCSGYCGMNRSDNDRAPVPETGENDRLIDRLFRSEAPRLARLFRRSIRNQDEVHDLVQDTFVNFVEARPRSKVRTPAAYLRTIARSLLWERTRRPRAHDRANHVPVDEAHELWVDPEQEWMMEASDFMRRYEEALSELPSRTREVFRLHRQEELTYQEIAEKLGITVDGVKYHMKKALLYLDHRVNANG